jgi:4'-phosphopantetheinyl transferase
VSCVDVWHVRTDEVTDDALVRACNGVLTPDERESGAALRFARHRQEHLVTRALARAALGRELEVHPASLRFRRTRYGRPELDPPCELRFNLSNTAELVVCAVARGREVGVDAESASRADEILEVARTVFTEAERAALAALDDAGRRTRAVQLWTAKEAYVKARGLGFSLPPRGLELDVGTGGVRLHFLAVNDDPGRWQIQLHDLDGHVVAVCVERSREGRPEIALRHADLRALLAPTASPDR